MRQWRKRVTSLVPLKTARKWEWLAAVFTEIKNCYIVFSKCTHSLRYKPIYMRWDEQRNRFYPDNISARCTTRCDTVNLSTAKCRVLLAAVTNHASVLTPSLTHRCRPTSHTYARTHAHTLVRTHSSLSQRDRLRIHLRHFCIAIWSNNPMAELFSNIPL